MKTKKILLTGGHASSTMYAVTEEIIRQKLSWQMNFVGAKSSVEGNRVKTLAEINFEKSNVKSYFLVMGRIQRKFTIWTIPSLLKIPLGFIHSLLLIKKIKPDVILSFGGFVSYPICFWGHMLRIPIIIHEQTSVAGRANQYASRFADKIALARKTSVKYFPKSKVVVTGNPISLGATKLKPKSQKGKPTRIFVHGGQSGSNTINLKIEKILNTLLDDFIVTHQTGERELSKYLDLKNSLEPQKSRRYHVVGVIKSSEFYKYLSDADILISRSGANITSEIIAGKIPSVLIPIPFSYLDEQTVNANYVKDLGLAEVIKQKDFSSAKLLQCIRKIDKNWHRIVDETKDIKSPDTNASERLVNLTKQYL